MTMREHERVAQCENCATVWALDRTAGSPELPAGRCPVCQLPYDGAEHAPAPLSGVGDLEAQLDALVRVALRSGISPEEVVGVLRDALTFAAEIGQDGRRFTVALIDLGPQEADLQRGAPQRLRDGDRVQGWPGRRGGD